jgi:hypothetical protein
VTLWIPGGIHPEVDFSVERHTLVTGEVIDIFHRSLAEVTQVAAARGHLFRVRAQLLMKIFRSYQACLLGLSLTTVRL